MVMRTTINIDDDLLYVAKEHAKSSKITLGQWVSLRLRESLIEDKNRMDHDTETPNDGIDIPVVKLGTRLVSNQMIDELRDKLGV